MAAAREEEGAERPVVLQLRPVASLTLWQPAQALRRERRHPAQ